MVTIEIRPTFERDNNENRALQNTYLENSYFKMGVSKPELQLQFPPNQHKIPQ